MPLHSSAPLPPHSLSLSQQTIAWPLHTPLPLLAALMIIQSDICDAGLNDDRLQHGLDFAIGEYNKERTMSTRATPCAVHASCSFTHVDLGGVSYFFGMKIGLTTGTKSQPDLDNCLISDQPQWKEKQFCSFQVYEVPSKDGMSLVKSIRGKA
uniref:Cystatin domain-containing protein n=1 Tax=Theropithecus gelada TaxID=9565 RepID=A0A8D2FW01_THEGE